MERHDDHAVHQDLVKAPFFLSIHFRVTLCVSILLVFGVAFGALFARVSTRASQEMREAVSLQSEFYQGVAETNLLINRLGHALGSLGEDSLQAYAEAKASFSAFLSSLREAALGPYSRDMCAIGDALLGRADEALLFAQTGDADGMLAAYEEASRISALISAFSSYVIREFELSAAGRIDAVTNRMTRAVHQNSVALIVTAALVIALVAGLMRSFLFPLRALTDAVRGISMKADAIEATDIEALPSSYAMRRDEAGILIRAFQEMARRIQRQVEALRQKQKVELELQQERERVMRTEAQLARSELRAYQSQINSHFLFNVLNTVSRLAYMEDAPQVQHAIALLAQFLRDILTQFDRTVTLQEDFEMVENYLNIQRLRFGDRIRVEAALDVDAEWFEVPALTLQPLVENAFRHGLSDRREGYIRYAAALEEDGVVISVWDDGKGVARPDELARFIVTGDDSPAATGGIGLRNIYRRLDTMYPGRVTPIVESAEGEYARIGFCIAHGEEDTVSG